MFGRYPKTVVLKDSTPVSIRLLEREDLDQLLAFVDALPDEDRLFLRHDVDNDELVRRRTSEVDTRRVIPLAAFDGDDLVGEGFLHFMPYEWMKHAGHVRLATARSHRNRGLGGLIMRELVWLASERRLEMLLAYTTDDNIGAIKMFTSLGFRKAAVLDHMVKDRGFKSRNLAIMINDVDELDRILEEWVHFSTLPGYRAPGAGA